MSLSVHRTKSRTSWRLNTQIPNLQKHNVPLTPRPTTSFLHCAADRISCPTLTHLWLLSLKEYTVAVYKQQRANRHPMLCIIFWLFLSKPVELSYAQSHNARIFTAQTEWRLKIHNHLYLLEIEALSLSFATLVICSMICHFLFLLCFGVTHYQFRLKSWKLWMFSFREPFLCGIVVLKHTCTYALTSELTTKKSFPRMLCPVLYTNKGNAFTQIYTIILCVVARETKMRQNFRWILNVYEYTTLF